MAALVASLLLLPLAGRQKRDRSRYELPAQVMQPPRSVFGLFSTWGYFLINCRNCMLQGVRCRAEQCRCLCAAGSCTCLLSCQRLLLCSPLFAPFLAGFRLRSCGWCVES